MQNKKSLFLKSWQLLVMICPTILLVMIFNIYPLFGLQIAFREFSLRAGMWQGDFVGFENFTRFFNDKYFSEVLINTLILSFGYVLVNFPMPIILALLLNEVGNKKFKTTIQTISYLPYFVSLVVIVGLYKNFFASEGVINTIIKIFGGKPQNFLTDPKWYRTVFILTGVYENIGWGTIVYVGALSGIDACLYEAASIDGANRWKQIFKITIPSLMPTIIVLLILQMGRMMGLGFDKAILMINDQNVKTSELISTYVYKWSFTASKDYSYATAIGIFNSIVNLGFLLSANYLSRRYTDTSLI